MLKNPKARLQTAALPYIHTLQGIEVALVTSRERNRWIIPKGWPKRRRSLRAMARVEALEEAGCDGIVSQDPIGRFSYAKVLKNGSEVECCVFVFSLLVTSQQLRWKEQGDRQVRWLPLVHAADLADDAELAHLLAHLAENPDVLKSTLADKTLRGQPKSPPIRDDS